MRKLHISTSLIFIAFILCAPFLHLASAQTPEYQYHRVGDTIVGRCPIYFYQWWTDDWLSDTSHRLISMPWREDIFPTAAGPGEISGAPYPHGEVMQYGYTDTPLKIIGIATSLYISDFNLWDTVGMEPVFQEYLRLYDASDDGMMLLEEVPYDIHTGKRYMKVDSRNPHLLVGDDCCYDAAIDRIDYREIREYYFDKPVIVTDSFYVGYTTECHMNTIPPGFEWPGGSIDTRTCGWEIFWDTYFSEIWYTGANCVSTCEEIPYILHRYKDIEWYMNPSNPSYGDTIPDTGWHWHYRPHFMLEFPIVLIDSLYVDHYECPPVENFRVGHYGEHNAVLLWNSNDEQQSYQLSYGPAGTPPDSGTFINAPINAYNIMGLDSGVHYDAYVRAICLHDSTVYSVWSDPVDIFIVDTSTHDVGIGDIRPESLLSDDGIVLVPNPATDEVTILSSAPIRQVEVFDMQGKLVHASTPPSQTSCLRLETLNYPKGAYTVRILTTLGTTSKRLVVK